MFKQLLILILLFVLVIIISYHIIKKIIIYFHKLVLSKFIIKYNLIELDKQFLNLHSEESDILLLDSVNSTGSTGSTRIVFYTDIPWSTKNNNYIFDINNNKYYIITDGYYYYIDSTKDFKITIGSPNGKVKMLLLLPNNNKVSFLENNNISTNKECLTKR